MAEVEDIVLAAACCRQQEEGVPPVAAASTPASKRPRLAAAAEVAPAANCRVCLSEQATHMIVPCGHICRQQEEGVPPVAAASTPASKRPRLAAAAEVAPAANCRVCLSEQATHMIVPCGHICRQQEEGVPPVAAASTPASKRPRLAAAAEVAPAANCRVCLSEQATHMIVPCGHICRQQEEGVPPVAAASTPASKRPRLAAAAEVAPAANCRVCLSEQATHMIVPCGHICRQQEEGVPPVAAASTPASKRPRLAAAAEVAPAANCRVCLSEQATHMIVPCGHICRQQEEGVPPVAAASTPASKRPRLAAAAEVAPAANCRVCLSEQATHMIVPCGHICRQQEEGVPPVAAASTPASKRPRLAAAAEVAPAANCRVCLSEQATHMIVPCGHICRQQEEGVPPVAAASTPASKRPRLAAAAEVAPAANCRVCLSEQATHMIVPCGHICRQQEEGVPPVAAASTPASKRPRLAAAAEVAPAANCRVCLSEQATHMIVPCGHICRQQEEGVPPVAAASTPASKRPRLAAAAEVAPAANCRVCLSEQATHMIVPCGHICRQQEEGVPPVAAASTPASKRPRLAAAAEVAPAANCRVCLSEQATHMIVPCGHICRQQEEGVPPVAAASTPASKRPRLAAAAEVAPAANCRVCLSEQATHMIVPCGHICRQQEEGVPPVAAASTPASKRPRLAAAAEVAPAANCRVCLSEQATHMIVPCGHICRQQEEGVPPVAAASTPASKRPRLAAAAEVAPAANCRVCLSEQATHMIVPCGHICRQQEEGVPPVAAASTPASKRPRLAAAAEVAPAANCRVCLSEQATHMIVPCGHICRQQEEGVPPVAAASTPASKRPRLAAAAEVAPAANCRVCLSEQATHMIVPCGHICRQQEEGVPPVAAASTPASKRPRLAAAAEVAPAANCRVCLSEQATHMIVPCGHICRQQEEGVPPVAAASTPASKRPRLAAAAEVAPAANCRVCLSEQATHMIVPCGHICRQQEEGVPPVAAASTPASKRPRLAAAAEVAPAANCRVCLSEQATHMIVPCGHICRQQEEGVPPVAAASTPASKRPRLAAAAEVAPAANCRVCLSEQATHMIVPCGHLCRQQEEGVPPVAAASTPASKRPRLAAAAEVAPAANCRVCLSEQATHMIVPCGHICRQQEEGVPPVAAASTPGFKKGHVLLQLQK
ncbi:uncharacterized protein LOC124358484 [Homalodisca vitripennis]|uniref:uncharacterized protein LOC124358484 n=1 Tax=Homalodisca vitripennis TaxID=197043 RepID=UPI001EEA9087|nr:uncharacterized protein LOC124358484 [Homalodisca vitripennis]